MKSTYSILLSKVAKMQSFKAAPCYKFGCPAPHTYDEALQLDLMDRNTKWQVQYAP